MSSLLLRGLFVDIGNIQFTTGSGQQVFGINGSTSTPFYAFSNSNDGIYYDSTGSAITFTFGGTSRFACNNAGEVSATRFLAGSGSPTGPTYTFTGNTGTGIYSAAASTINISTGSSLRLTLNTTNLTTTLAILNQNGTASLPAYSFSADSTTGMFSNGSGTLAFGTSATQRLLINNTNLTSTLAILNQSGTVTLPAYSFSNSTNTGMYSSAANTVNLSTAGVLRVTLDATNLTTTLPVVGPVGTAALPTYVFTGRTNTGMYSSAVSTLNLSTAGVLRVTLDATNLTTTLPVVGPVGTAALPTYVFTGRTNTGMYSSAVSTLNLSTGGVLRVTLSTANLTTTLAILNQNGTAALPAYSFSGSTNTGIYSAGAGIVNISTAATLRVTIDSTNLTTTLAILNRTGTASLPAYSFTGDSTTGMFSTGTGVIAFGTSATQRFSISTTNLISTLAILNQSGTLALPAYSFSGDPNTGIYNPAADTVVIVGNGIQSLKTDSKNNVIIGTETALATTSTDGFLYIPSVGGTPTTAPATSYTGKVPMSFDTTGETLNIYTASKWIQAKTNYWHYEGTTADSSTQFSDGVVGTYFPGSTYYNMGVNGDSFSMYVRLKWTAKVAPTTGNLRTVFILPTTFPVVLPGTLSTIPVGIGYKEGISFATQFGAIASMANLLGNVVIIISYILYSQTASNPSVYVVNGDVASDGQITISFTVPLFQTIDPSPIAGF